MHIFLICIEVLFIHDVSGTYTSSFSDTDELEMALLTGKVSWAFEKRALGLNTAPYHRSHGFESRSSRIFFQALISQMLKFWV